MIPFSAFKASLDRDEKFKKAQKNRPYDHVEAHQAVQFLASKHRSYSMGAANYRYLTGHSDRSRIEKHYNKTVAPLIKKHGMPSPSDKNWHKVEKDLVNNWKKEKRID